MKLLALIGLPIFLQLSWAYATENAQISALNGLKEILVTSIPDTDTVSLNEYMGTGNLGRVIEISCNLSEIKANGGGKQYMNLTHQLFTIPSRNGDTKGRTILSLETGDSSNRYKLLRCISYTHHTPEDFNMAFEKLMTRYVEFVR